jgi:hypothetical protein
MKKIFYLLLFGYQLAIGQSVTINPQSNNSGIINAESTTKGVLFPSMTTLQRTNIISPQAGLLVFDSTTDSFWYHDGTSWSELNTSNSSQWATSGTNIYSSNPGNVGIGIAPTKAKLEVSTSATTQAIFGSGGNGISIQKDFPTIGFNQYRDDANVQRYIGTGFAGGNYFDPTNGNLFWSTINTGSAGNPTTGETARMVLKYNGFLGIGTLSPTAMLHVAGFTRLGSDAPSIKMKLITGTIPCLSNNCHSPIPHGLTAAKIISVSVFISTASGEAYAPAQNEATFSGNYYYYSIDATNIDIYHPSSGTANTLGRPYRILIIYQE